MHLMDGGAGKEPLLLLFGQLLLLSLDIRTAGRFAQGRVCLLYTSYLFETMGYLIFGSASRLDAFSVYPIRT